MKVFTLVAITLVVFLAVTKAEEDPQEKYKKNLMKHVAEMREFFKNDPAGQKMAKVFHEFIDFVKIVRKRVKSMIKEYAKKLMKDGDKDDDDDDE